MRDRNTRPTHDRRAGRQTTPSRTPGFLHTLFYGVDTPDREKLLAARMDVAAMAAHLAVDSLAFISIDDLYRAMGAPSRDPAAPGFCDACFTGDYPIPLGDREAGADPLQLPLLAERA